MDKIERRVALGSDHAGYSHKEYLKNRLQEAGYTIVDCGTYSNERADYPDFGAAVGREVVEERADVGIVVCGSGIGISIAANKIAGIRAANCVTEEMALLSRQHNDANILGIGERLISKEEAWRITQTFLKTEFEGGRHTGRVEKIDAIERRGE